MVLLQRFCLFFYPQDPNYSILHTIWHFNTLVNKNTTQNETFKFTTSSALMPVLVVEKMWRS
jgi:hypothetical protein